MKKLLIICFVLSAFQAFAVNMDSCTLELSKRVGELRSNMLRDNEDVVVDKISLPQLRLLTDVVIASKDCNDARSNQNRWWLVGQWHLLW